MATRMYGAEEFDNLKRWLEANQDSISEKMISELEQIIAKEYNTKRIIAVNSCMGALHIALQTIGVGPGDARMTPAILSKQSIPRVRMTSSNSSKKEVLILFFTLPSVSQNWQISSIKNPSSSR